MEKIKQFVTVVENHGYGYGSGYGSGSGSGYGYGSGYGSGDGYGYGSGYGSGSGSGSGSGYGSGSGDGYGDGYGYGIKIFNGQEVYLIDSVPTIITAVVFGLARGYILGDDLMLSPCYVAKRNNQFAHGETKEKALEALTDKMFDDMPEEERIEEFWKCHEHGIKYSAKDLFEWHHKLTGSCEMGRMAFVKKHDIDLDNGLYTVEEFVHICQNDYGGSTIKKLMEK